MKIISCIYSTETSSQLHCFLEQKRESFISVTMKLLVFLVSLTFFGLVIGDTEGGANEKCHASGEAEGGDEHAEGGDEHAWGGRDYAASKDSLDKCWGRHVTYSADDLHGVNDTSKIHAAFVAICAQNLTRVNKCMEVVQRNSHCQTAEERAALRLHAIYKNTIFEVQCRNEAALLTQIHVGKMRIQSTQPEGGPDPTEECVLHQGTVHSNPVEGINMDMVQLYMHFKSVISCLEKVDKEGREEAVDALIAMATALLDSIICVHPTDGTDVLCKTLLVE